MNETLPTCDSRLAEGDLRPELETRDISFIYSFMDDDSSLMPSRASSVRSTSAAPVLSTGEWDESDDSDVFSDEPPCLTRGNSIASSKCAARTDEASEVHDGYLLELVDGVLTLPNRFEPDADLLCPFQVLDCTATFSHIVNFKMHVFSHFKGHPLPTGAKCFLCDKMFDQTANDDSAWAWNNMLGHLAYDHFRQGQRLATIRTDFTLMRWMYNRRIISDDQFKRTQLCPTPITLPEVTGSGPEVVNLPLAPMPPSTAPPVHHQFHSTSSVRNQSEPFVVMAGRRAERMRRDATRPYARAHTRTNM